VDTDRTVRIHLDRTVQLRKPEQSTPMLETGPLSPSILTNEQIIEPSPLVSPTSRLTAATDASLGRQLLPDAFSSSAIRPLEPPSFATSRPRKNKALILTVASVMLFIGGSIYSVVQNQFGFMNATDPLATDFGALKAGGVVSDVFTVLDPSDRAQLEHLSDDLQKQTGAQLAFVIVKSLGKQPIEAVSKQIFDTFVVGRQGVNDGVMVLLSSDDHDSRILYGEGLNPALSAQSPHILDEMRTSLQSGKFGSAMLSAGSKLRDAIVNAKRQGQTQSTSEPPLQATSPDSQAESAGQFNLGVRYLNGTGVAKDEVQAVAWFRKAAEQGYAAGQNHLGFMYQNGTGVAKDEVQAVAWYRKAAEQGLANGQNNLGFMYQNGTGVAKDEVQAVAWYRKAAEQGLAAGQHNLGAMYQHGTGVAKDEVQAVAWYRRAAEQGLANGQNNLGFMYQDGTGVAKDEVQAVAWYRKAAEQGLAEGQNNLGFMYDRGTGVPRNSVTAYMWWNLAAAGGSKIAEKERDRLGSSMTAGDVAKAQQLSSERIPK
ncbi:MAG: hypothetical protein EBY17_26805, partial [Acidobacteriia bacterium]|nr:hypothetical protein [Terriglobia bacterium]